MDAWFCGSDAGTLPGPTVQKAGVSAEGGLFPSLSAPERESWASKPRRVSVPTGGFGRIRGSDRLPS